MSEIELGGRVLRSQSGFNWVETPRGVVRCTLRGRFKRGKATTDLVVIGDRVRLRLEAPREDSATPDSPDAEPIGVIESIEPRVNRFARRQPGSRGRYKEAVLVANLDWLLVVMACDRPAMNPRLLDRFLVVAELDDLDVAIVANKVDLVGEDAARAAFEPYAALGYRVLYTTAAEDDGAAPHGADAIAELCRDSVSAVVGPSGVGKSSLLNAIAPGLSIHTGAVSEALHKGKHTTRVAQLHRLPHGGYLADTPGIRELASFALPVQEVAACFPEMRPYLGTCRFPDCTHDHEPGCAVRAAVAEGVISAARHDSYLRIRAGEER